MMLFAILAGQSRLNNPALTRPGPQAVNPVEHPAAAHTGLAERLTPEVTQFKLCTPWRGRARSEQPGTVAAVRQLSQVIIR
eukprot:653841-Hanusia_phi.AAC.2